jgi:Uma2 family endonuclease
MYYKNIPSLREYIMIDTAKRFVQAVRKQPDGDWRFEDITEPSGQLHIETIQFSISFDELYHNTGL